MPDGPSRMNNVLCRLCLKKCEELFGMCITSPEGVLRNLPKMIQECILIEVSDCEPHFFSKFICNECIYRLELFYTFREQSLKNQEYYNGLLLYYQQTMPCTSKAISPPVHETNVFGIGSDMHTESDQPGQQTDELPDINFTMMDDAEKNQLSKDYDDIIRSLQKDDLDFTANEEELVIKHELEISIQESNAERKRTEAMKQDKQQRANDAGALSDSHIIQTQSNECFDPYVAIAQSISGHDTVVHGTQQTTEPDDGLDYDDFAGIETAVGSDDNEETITSEIQVQRLIENVVPEENLDIMQIVSASSGQLPASTSDDLMEPLPKTDQNVQFDKTLPHGLSVDCNYAQAYCTKNVPTIATSSHITTIASVVENPPSLDDKTCEVCLKTFRSRQKLKIHRNTHLRVAPFKCTFEGCAKAFKSRIGLEEHLARHTNCFEYTCDICSKGFQHRSYLSAHRRAHNMERNFQCTECGQAFKSKQALSDHKNRHLGLKPFACDQCDKQYTKNSLLQAHIKQHHSDEPEGVVVRYPCPECGKKFTSKSYLTVHRKIHRNERDFVCEICKKGHVTRQDLLIHMTKHTGEKSLVCDICGKAYARRSAMEWHRRTHTKDTPYKCDICGQTFTQATPLQVHRRLHDTAAKLDVKKQTPVSETGTEQSR